MASGHSRIGIIGTGAIGGFYGLMLARAGQDVHFLLRSEYAAVTARGLRVESQVHGALQLDSVQAYRQAADMPPCDWLFVAAKTTSNAALAPAIVQAAAPGAKVVLLQNGLGVEDALRPCCVMTCTCSVGSARSAPTAPSPASSCIRPWARSISVITPGQRTPNNASGSPTKVLRCSGRLESTRQACPAWRRHAG